MRKFITITMAVICLAFQPMSAQKKNDGTENYEYHKVCEIMDNGGDPKEAPRLASENIKENPNHIHSYLFSKFLIKL